MLARQTHEEAVEVVTSKARELGCPVVRAEGAVAVELLGQGIDQVVPDSVPPR